jgi:26S proteasome regulatory subunit N1
MTAQKAHLSAATVGVALIAMGEELGTNMASRMLEHLLSYADADVRAAVPLTLALLRPSSPDMATMDTLSRLSHDADNDVARASLLGLGIIGAGTNNARLAGVAPLGPIFLFQNLPDANACAPLVTPR